MAKHTNRQNNSRQNAAAKNPVTAQKKPLLSGPVKPHIHVLVITGIVLLTWLHLSNCLQNQLGLWDDTPYIKDNWLVKNITWQGIKNIFSNPSMGNYHPFTILSYAIEYSVAHLEPWLYHFDNLALHIAVVILVYWLVQLLTGRLIASAITALLFGMHPMHVESVAWVASRKDLLCGLFYFGACIAYICYQRTATKKPVWYAAVLILFLCALLSKGVAVTLPLSLLLIDHFEGRGVTVKMLLEKIPHFLLALLFGIIAIWAQRTAGAMEMNIVHYNIPERFALGCYALITYLWKAIAPVQLHCLYPYPAKVNGSLPYEYYIFPLLVIALAYIIWRYARANKVVVFGLLFFLVNIALVLQFLPVGDAIVAERYTYIPYMGLLFIMGYYFSRLFEPGIPAQYKYIASGAAFIYIAWLGHTDKERCEVWHDEISLWRDETEKEPKNGVRAFNNLGFQYYEKWQGASSPYEKATLYDSAAYFMNTAIALQPAFVNPYMALGELQRSAGKYEDAKRTYFSALKYHPENGNLYFGLAIVHYVTKNMDSAGYYFRKNLEIAPSAQAYGNYANYLALTGRDDSALTEYNKAIALTKEDFTPYMNRGNLYKKMNRWPEALQDYESAIRINPDAGQLYYLRSFCDTQQKNTARAVADIEKAISLGFQQIDTNYYNNLKRK